MTSQDIEYSEKYYDDDFEYRCVRRRALTVCLHCTIFTHTPDADALVAHVAVHACAAT